MTLEQLVGSLMLPDNCRVNQRVPKKLLVEKGDPTAADKRLIQDSVEDLMWVAALKPETIGVPAYRDDTREYLELAVLTLCPRAAPTPRLAELIHRAIPYPVLLIMAAGHESTVSLAHIRWAQREADRTVLDGSVVLATVPDDAVGQSFAQALSLQNQPRTHMLDLYQGWLDTATALQAAALTGQFSTSPSREAATSRRAALHQCHELDGKIATLRAAARKEKQMARQVAANIEIKALLAKRHNLATRI